MKNFRGLLREHAMKIIIFKKKNEIINRIPRIFYICKEKFESKYLKEKKL